MVRVRTFNDTSCMVTAGTPRAHREGTQRAHGEGTQRAHGEGGSLDPYRTKAKRNWLELPRSSHRHRTVRYHTVWHRMACYHTVRHGTVRHDTVRHDTVRHDTVRHDTVRHHKVYSMASHGIQRPTIRVRGRCMSRVDACHG